MDFWNLILKSNTFNFIILLLLLTVILKKINLVKLIDEIKIKITEKLNNTEIEKSNADEALEAAKSKLINIDTEINEKNEIANTRANNAASMIKEVTERKLNQIAANTKKTIENDTKSLINILSDKTAKDSIEMAERFIRNKLKAEPNLHNKYIDESIENLDRVLI